MSQLEDLRKFSQQLTQECTDLLIQKSEQYNPDGNFTGTFEFAARLSNVSPAQAILSRMGDKLIRLAALLHKRRTENLTVSDIEATDDAIIDLINYLILMKWAIK